MIIEPAARLVVCINNILELSTVRICSFTTGKLLFASKVDYDRKQNVYVLHVNPSLLIDLISFYKFSCSFLSDCLLGRSGGGAGPVGVYPWNVRDQHGHGAALRLEEELTTQADGGHTQDQGRQ